MDTPQGNLPSRRTVGKLFLALAGVLLVVLGYALWRNIWDTDPVGDQSRAPAAPVTEQPVTPPKLTQVEQWFGPWHLSAGATGSASTILMLQSRAIQISSYGITPDSTWKSANLAEFDIEADTTVVRLRSHSVGMIYEIKPGQPFILDERPEYVYVITPTGNGTFAVTAQSTEWAHAHATKEGNK